MSLQKIVLEQFVKTYHQPTLREISSLTGIQITRVFRLMNGMTMKLDEYEIFRNLLDKNSDEFESSLQKLLHFGHYLPKGLSDDLKSLTERKLRLLNYNTANFDPKVLS